MSIGICATLDKKQPKATQDILDNAKQATRDTVLFDGKSFGVNKKITAGDVMDTFKYCNNVLVPDIDEKKSKKGSQYTIYRATLCHKANKGKSRFVPINNICCRRDRRYEVYSFSANVFLNPKSLTTKMLPDACFKIGCLSTKEMYNIFKGIKSLDSIMKDLPYDSPNGKSFLHFIKMAKQTYDYEQEILKMGNVKITKDTKTKNPKVTIKDIQRIYITPRRSKSYMVNGNFTSCDNKYGVNIDQSNETKPASSDTGSRSAITELIGYIHICTQGKMSYLTEHCVHTSIIPIPDCLYLKFMEYMGADMKFGNFV